MSEAEALLELFNKLPAEEKTQVERDVATILAKTRWIPQEGPQTECYFSDADEVFFGGQAGGGKSAFLVGYAINEAKNAVIFRNGLKNLRDLESYAKTLVGKDCFNQQLHLFDLSAIEPGKSLEFGSLEQPDSEEDWQGRRRDFMAFDEAAQMVKSRVQFVLGWAGSATEGQRTRVVFGSNPPLSDEGNWLFKWFEPWVDPMFPNKAKPGELRWFVNDKDGEPVWVKGPGRYDRGDGVISTAKSRTFIPSKLDDNRFLRDTDYRSRLESLPEPMRSAMLKGDFLAGRVDHAFQILPSDWLRKAQARWKAENSYRPMISLGADVAGGGADKEVFAPLHVGNHFGELKKHQGVDTKDGHATAGRMIAAHRNGAPIGIDMTGGWGGASATALKSSEIDVVPVVFSNVTGAVDGKTKIPYANLRAEMYWEFKNALDPNSGEDIALPPDAIILAEGSAPRWELRGGKIYVESKEDIRARLKASTDHFDAIVIAWHIRARGLAKRAAKANPRAQVMQTAEMDPFANDGF